MTKTLKMNKHEVINNIREGMIYHGWFENGVKMLERCFEGAVEASDLRGLMILGESGTGKTSLLKHFTNDYPTVRKPEGLKVPVLSAMIPPKPTVKGLAELLLYYLGDPLFDKGTESVKTTRLIKLLKATGAKMLILDEFQHFVDQGSYVIQHHVADWLKIVVEKAEVSLVVAGLPYCINVIQTNPQLKRRFQRPILLPRFDWLDDYHREQFIEILVVMQESLTAIEIPAVRNEEMAFRYYCASGGLIGRVANIFIEVIHNVYESQDPRVTLSVLEKAANDASYDLPDEIKNPFSSKVVSEITKKIIDIVKTIGRKVEIEKPTNTKKRRIKTNVSDVLKK